jgi:hypothetical protein
VKCNLVARSRNGQRTRRLTDAKSIILPLCAQSGGDTLLGSIETALRVRIRTFRPPLQGSVVDVVEVMGMGRRPNWALWSACSRRSDFV